MPFIISVFKCFCFCLKTPFQFLQILIKVSYHTYIWPSSTLNSRVFFKSCQNVSGRQTSWGPVNFSTNTSIEKTRHSGLNYLSLFMSGRKTRALFVDFMIPISRGVYNEHVTIVDIFWSFKKWNETTNNIIL